jgi:hypothetical protein
MSSLLNQPDQRGGSRTRLPRSRPFRLVDVMILVLAAALGLASMRGIWNQFQTIWASLKLTPSWQAYAGVAQVCSTIALIDLAVAYGWIRMVPPQIPLSDLIRQPGMLVLELLVGLSFPLLLLSAFLPMVAPVPQIFAVVLGLSWLMACRRLRSRAEPGWIEALGRSLGIGLILAIATT